MKDVLRVVQPGILTTIQDLGRPNAVASGVSAGGAMDRFAHSAANVLVGNDRSAATLECTLRGPRLTAVQACLVAITGADLEPRINGAPAPLWTSITLAAGDEVSFASRRSGARAYLAVAGGFAGDRWLGSFSTDLLCERGGVHGRALAAGDVLSAGQELWPAGPGRTLAATRRPDYGGRNLHVIAGPHFDRLTPESRRSLFEAPLAVHHDSNRMGYRLDGAALEAPGEELLSFAVIAGAIQLPRDGHPILLMADHQTAGGYPVIATVISASLPVAAQLAPGDEVRLDEISLEDALKERAAQREALDSIS